MEFSIRIICLGFMVGCLAKPRPDHYPQPILDNLAIYQSIHPDLCPSDYLGVRNYPYDCFKYISCRYGKPFVMNCPPGTLFNPARKFCDFSERVLCKVPKHPEKIAIPKYIWEGDVSLQQDVIPGHLPRMLARNNGVSLDSLLDEIGAGPKPHTTFDDVAYPFYFGQDLSFTIQSMKKKRDVGSWPDQHVAGRSAPITDQRLIGEINEYDRDYGHRYDQRSDLKRINQHGADFPHGYNQNQHDQLVYDQYNDLKRINQHINVFKPVYDQNYHDQHRQLVYDQHSDLKRINQHINVFKPVYDQNYHDQHRQLVYDQHSDLKRINQHVSDFKRVFDQNQHVYDQNANDRDVYEPDAYDQHVHDRPKLVRHYQLNKNILKPRDQSAFDPSRGSDGDQHGLIIEPIVRIDDQDRSRNEGNGIIVEQIDQPDDRHVSKLNGIHKTGVYDGTIRATDTNRKPDTNRKAHDDQESKPDEISPRINNDAIDKSVIMVPAVTVHGDGVTSNGKIQVEPKRSRIVRSAADFYDQSRDFDAQMMAFDDLARQFDAQLPNAAKFQQEVMSFDGDEQLMDDHAIDQMLVDQSLMDEKLVDHRLTDQKVVNERLTDQKVTDQKVTDHTLMDQKLMDHNLMDLMEDPKFREQMLTNSNLHEYAKSYFRKLDRFLEHLGPHYDQNLVNHPVQNLINHPDQKLANHLDQHLDQHPDPHPYQNSDQRDENPNPKHHYHSNINEHHQSIISTSFFEGFAVVHYDDQHCDVRCDESITGTLPHPIHCSKFIECHRGRTIVRDCASGTQFNFKIDRCDYARNVRCDFGERFARMFRTCETFSVQAANQPDNYGRTKQTDIPKWVNQTDIPDRINPPQMPSRTNMPDIPKRTNQLNIKLKNEHPQDRLVIHDTFHVTLERSDGLCHVSCVTDSIHLLPHPTDCAKFVRCVHGNVVVQTCGPGTVFNAKLSVCDFPFNVDCSHLWMRTKCRGFVMDVTDRTDRTDGHTDLLDVVIDQIASERGHKTGGKSDRIIDQTVVDRNRGKNHKTIDVPIEMSQKMDQIIDKLERDQNIEQTTNDPDKNHAPNMLLERLIDENDIPNGTDLTWQPMDGFLVKQDIQTNTCHVKCDRNTSTFLAHPTSCEKFVECRRGVTMIHKCATGLRFSARERVCVTKDRAECVFGMFKKTLHCLTFVVIETEPRDRVELDCTSRSEALTVGHEDAQVFTKEPSKMEMCQLKVLTDQHARGLDSDRGTLQRDVIGNDRKNLEVSGKRELLEDDQKLLKINDQTLIDQKLEGDREKMGREMIGDDRKTDFLDQSLELSQKIDQELLDDDQKLVEINDQKLIDQNLHELASKTDQELLEDDEKSSKISDQKLIDQSLDEDHQKLEQQTMDDVQKLFTHTDQKSDFHDQNLELAQKMDQELFVDDQKSLKITDHELIDQHLNDDEQKLEQQTIDDVQKLFTHADQNLESAGKIDQELLDDQKSLKITDQKLIDQNLDDDHQKLEQQTIDDVQKLFTHTDQKSDFHDQNLELAQKMDQELFVDDQKSLKITDHELIDQNLNESVPKMDQELLEDDQKSSKITDQELINHHLDDDHQKLEQQLDDVQKLFTHTDQKSDINDQRSQSSQNIEQEYVNVDENLNKPPLLYPDLGQKLEIIEYVPFEQQPLSVHESLDQFREIYAKDMKHIANKQDKLKRLKQGEDEEEENASKRPSIYQQIRKNPYVNGVYGGRNLDTPSKEAVRDGGKGARKGATKGGKNIVNPRFHKQDALIFPD